MSEVGSNRLKDKLNAIHTYTYSKALPPINQPKTNTKQAKCLWVKCEKVKDEQ